MKTNKVFTLAALAVLLSFTVAGCRNRVTPTTPLPGAGKLTPEEPAHPLAGNNNAKSDDTAGIKTTDDKTSSTLIAPAPLPKIDPNKNIGLNADLIKMVPDSEANQIFRGKTVYFEFDKSTVKQGDLSKIEEVASGMKGLTGKALRIEGHCDERGTEEYNRSLGERRALAVREALVRAGLDANLIDTISFGEDRPAEPGHNESAWSKNRRGEFVIIVSPTAVTSQ